MAVRYPNIVREIARQGHEVANHTFTHPNISGIDDQALLNELGQTRQVIQQLTGQDTRLYRPPGGNFSRRSLRVASQAGYHMILWTVLTKDVSGASVPAMRRHILNSVADGAIVLMHSGIPNTVEMLPGVIEELRREGYHFVTVSQMLGFDHSHGGYELRADRARAGAVSRRLAMISAVEPPFPPAPSSKIQNPARRYSVFRHWPLDRRVARASVRFCDDGALSGAPRTGRARRRQRSCGSRTLRNPWSFLIWVKLFGHPGAIKPGVYELSARDNGWTIYRKFRKGPPLMRVTFPEGWTAKQMAAVLDAGGITPSADFLATVDKEKREGFLFPDTYFFEQGLTADQVIGCLVAALQRERAEGFCRPSQRR